MSYIMVDIEADGPIPGDYSMVSFGAVVVEPGLAREFYGQLRPISDNFVPEALAVSGFGREETLTFPEPEGVMRSFAAWIASAGGGRPLFISDNNGFDWQFINWYFHHFTGANPFGFSSTNLGSLYIPPGQYGSNFFAIEWSEVAQALNSACHTPFPWSSNIIMAPSFSQAINSIHGDAADKGVEKVQEAGDDLKTCGTHDGGLVVG